MIIGASITGFSLPYLYTIDWVGLGEDKIISRGEHEAINLNNGKIVKLQNKTEYTQPEKTLWDWLGLLSSLAIPIFVVFLTYQVQRNEQIKAEERAKFEKEKIINNSNEEAVQVYIDRMSELLIDKNVKALPIKDPLRDAALDVARIRTLSVLRRLDKDGERKGNIIRFLIDAGFIEKLKLDLSNVDLSNSNLSGVNLSDANLCAVNLSDANLCAVNLNNTNLSTANLGGANFNCSYLNDADLSGVDLCDANLSGASFRGGNLIGSYLIDANLSSADFRDANLSGADLSRANLSNAYLSSANLNGANLNGANLNGAKFEHHIYGTAKNITPEQIKQADNWEKAVYNPEFRKRLGLPPEDE